MRISFIASSLLAALILAPAATAELQNPGSVLIYPIHRSGPGLFTVVTVTNTNLNPQTPTSFGGSVLAHFQYVNTIPNPADTQLPLGCYINDRTEFLTPADTLSVLTTCHNAASAEGYLVIHAQSPATIEPFPINFDFLIGSELVVNSEGGLYSLNAYSIRAGAGPGEEATEVFGTPFFDPTLHFDGFQYAALPEILYCDEFLAVTGSSLTLLNLTGADFTCVVRFDIWNDNEKPLSATKAFRCWMEERLVDINPVFSNAYLSNNTPNDPSDLDINCDNVDDLEHGWFRIVPLVAFSDAQSVPHPAVLGAITDGPISNVDGGRHLWGSTTKTKNGAFLQFGSVIPNF